MNDTRSSIVLGGGCFWCVEAAFKLLPGVTGVEPGYAGGSVDNPSYEEICTGRTGHAEVVRVDFDPSIVALDRILDLFFEIHDPTTRDRQGADIGPQYRSIILFSAPGQEEAAGRAIARAASGRKASVVTVIEPLGTFWPAEDYHHDFFAKNPFHGYCRAVVAPKVRKAGDFVARTAG